MTNSSLFGEVVHSYSRAQALADGFLIDVSATAEAFGFSVPVALTAAAWADCVAWSDAGSRRQTGQGEHGRLVDVLWLARMAMRTASGNAVLFELSRVPRDGKTRHPRRVLLKLTIGPGDHGEPVMTLMLPDED